MSATDKPRQMRSDLPGFTTRSLAAEALFEVLHRRRPLDEIFDSSSRLEGLDALPERDRALVRMLVTTCLRRLGTLRALISAILDRGLPKDAPKVELALLLGAAQLLFLNVPDHAAVDLSVRLVSKERSGRYAGVVNAVLRRLAREGRDRLARLDPLTLDTPSWLLERWQNNYGADTAAAIAAAHAIEPPLDLTVKHDAAVWAEKLGGRLLSTGSVRLLSRGPIADLPGFSEGEWWVQDMAASLPARLFGPVAGLVIADLCAAPGGKTAQLAVAGARVTAVDRSEPRLARLQANLDRLRLCAETVAADVSEWHAEPFDGVLLDAPCSATGTIRRHPDVPWQKRPQDIVSLVNVQARLLDRAAALTKPAGLLVYATCSLEPEESEMQIEALLSRRNDFARVPVTSSEVGDIHAAVTPAGDLRTLPCHLPDPDPRFSSCDGFFAARLRRLF